MDEFTLYCTSEQTCRALELGAPLEFNPMFRYGDNSLPKFVHKNKQNLDEFCYCPTAEQMVGWLEKQYIRVYAQPYIDECDTRFKGKFRTVGEHTVKDSESRKEALLAAIDAALEYLGKKNKPLTLLEQILKEGDEFGPWDLD